MARALTKKRPCFRIRASCSDRGGSRPLKMGFSGGRWSYSSCHCSDSLVRYAASPEVTIEGQPMLDVELLRLNERIEIALQLGESHCGVFKSGLIGAPSNQKQRPLKEVCVDVGETLVAFANADGGELLVGVEDDGTVSGLSYDEQGLTLLQHAVTTHVHRDTPLPPPRIA